MRNRKLMQVTFVLSMFLGSVTNLGATEELDDCGKAWIVQKSGFLKGEKPTLTSLSFGTLFRGLVFPGAPNDNSALKRYALNLAMHGLDSEMPDSYKLAISLVKPFSNERAIHPVLTCLEEQKDHQECIDLAIRKKTILPFEELVEELEFFASREGTGNAYCLIE